MKRHALFLALAALLALPPAGAFAQENDTLAFERGFWLDMNQGEGLKLRLASYNDGRPLFGSSQSLSVLIVSPERECALVAAPEGKLALTSEMAADAGAAAAVNGSFFHMKAPYGGSTYARIDGVKVSENAPVENFRRDPQRSGAIVVRDGKFSIVTGFGPERTYEEALPGETVLTTGPMLLQAGDTCALHPFKFNSNRHPRTAFGIRPDGSLVFVVADGRSPQAAGLSMAELRQVMLWLGCRDAINLDGGGSSTMVFLGRIVNHPCDNHQFDEAGERPVANAWVIR